MLTQEGCKARQQKLLQAMAEREWDTFLSTDHRTVYYFTGSLSDSPSAFICSSDGQTKHITIETYSIDRVVEYPEQELLAQLRDLPWKGRCGIEQRSGIIFIPETQTQDATQCILRLRRHKEPDEIGEIETALGLCAVAYDAAKAAIAPGLREVDIYSAMHAAIVKHAETSVPFPGDFACGERGIKGGGPPTQRLLKSGDLYILDIFPAPALYFADTCRTFSIGEPTDLQIKAWELVAEAVKLAESLVRPGVEVRKIYQQVKDFLDASELSQKSFWHHLGHGIGHRGHEAPRIIPGSNETFEIGDVITLEPGVYTKALQGGIRLEDNYIVEQNGLRNLFPYPRGLV